MNAQEWNKLVKNWDRLMQLLPDDIIVHLYTEQVIDCKDKQEVEAETTCFRKMNKLLDTLKSKPPERKAYDVFLEALEKDKMTAELAKVIRDTETTSDPLLKSTVDPHLLDPEVRIVLHKFLENKMGASTALSKVREILQSNGVFNGRSDWNNKILAEFVCKEFVSVELKDVKKRSARNSKKETQDKGKVSECISEPLFFNLQRHFKNIGLKNLTKTQSSSSEEREHAVNVTSGNNEQQVENAIKVQQMTPEQLKEYLQPKLEAQNLPIVALDDLVNANVTGSVFLTMTEDDLKEVIPSVTFGVRRFLSMQISENCPVKITSYRDYLRNFDTEVKHTNKYIKGNCVDAYVNVRGKTTDPVRNFHVIEQDEKEPIEFVTSEVVPFVSACLNDRRNGTIYFGISPSNTDQYKHGEVVGVDLSKEDLQAEISDSLMKCFSTSYSNIISSTVRDAKFVPVISDTSKDQDSNLWIVEIDVVPSSCMMKDVTIRTKLKHLPIHARKQKSKATGVFRFSADGVPEIIKSDEKMYDYERDREQIIQKRQEEEAAAQKQFVRPPNLKTRLLNLLTGGTEVMQDTIYPFIFTSSIDSHMDEDYLSSNMAFIKQLKPEVVYDFDTTGSTNGLYKNLESVQGEVMRVLTTDNFDKVKCSKEQYKTFTEGLAAENRTSWIFCNGYDVMNLDQMEPTEWNRKRRTAFQESLQFFKDNFDEDRIIIIICLFSKMYNVMIEACEEVLTKFPDNWLLLAESEDIAKLWQDQMFARNKTEKKALEDRCVVGMPWDHVNTTIRHAFSTTDFHCECFLPASSGALIEVKEKKLKDWCDIDVLTGGDFSVYANEKDKKKLVEEKFYRGDQVNWLNFYFHDQVLKRGIHDQLMQTVKDALEGNNKEYEDKVTNVLILHQPGAGGTTSAKQVLWDLRKEYRCCVLNTITDQTCDQLDEVRNYGDPSPKPLLILIDNEDEDKCLQLRGNLEEKGRKLSRHTDASFNVYCTIILCIRKASLPKQIKQQEISLRQELNQAELNWFKVKNESLESRFNKDQEGNVNPKFLISFNILRENFNKEYISKVVKEFSDDVKTPREVKLLKIISLLNAYDPEFKPIPVSCLDKILQQEQNVQRWHGAVKRIVNWEANLSQGVRVLLNLSSSKHHPGKARNSLRVFNKNIAQEILTRMKERTGQKESEIMQELFESGTFEQETFESKKLQTLINNVIKKRELRPDGRKHKFSKFVIYVKDNEGAEVAVNILEQLFDLKEDPFTAQLIARFYIDMKNWSKAEQFAKIATSKLPSNSFLWDTYGQVFKNQLFDRISPDGFKDEDIPGLIALSEKCIKVFRKEQEVSENEVTTNGDNNFAGYFGELRAILLLLSALKMCPSFSSGERLHQFLVDDGYKPHHLNFLNTEEANYVKTLEKSCKEAMRRLDEEYLQMKSNLNVEMATSKSDYDKKSLLDLKVNLDEYFGEASNSIPAYLKESDASEYIRRRVRQLGATTLYSLLILRQHKKTDIIKQIYVLTMRNIDSKSCTFDDWKTILDTVTVLYIDNGVPPSLEFNTILEWCKTLYTMNNPQGTDRTYLEKFLYFVLYNFPTEERQKFSICSVQDLSSAIDKWQKAFQKNYPKFRKEEIKLKRRETTLFFLGNGSPLKDIVHQDSLTEMGQYSLKDKWDLPEVRQKLRMMSGSLCDHGERVQITITTSQGNKFPFYIQTSHRVTKKDMWQKKVFFYLGFSFSGPRAFGMSTEELGIKEVPAPSVRTQTYSSSVRPSKEYSHPMLTALYRDLKEAQLKRKREMNRSAQLEQDKRIQHIISVIKKLIGEPVDD